ncbi:BnaA10g28110D [Brassica napus]|uniref:BnaA10g28110D protein n=1 Tax=Brassica napus TaxID=3708 RepID=A0A078IN44_BRANA|nr:BnaA10g28110D [Brassica napus]
MCGLGVIRDLPMTFQGLDDLTLVDIDAGGSHSTSLTGKGDILKRREHRGLGKLIFSLTKISCISLKEDLIHSHFPIIIFVIRLVEEIMADGYGRNVTPGQPLELFIYFTT